MKELLQRFVDQNRNFTNLGKVASYIPELARANQSDLGVVVYKLDGENFEAGNCDVSFTIQSISKPIVLLLALLDNGEDTVFNKVGQEPTGDPFNSIIRLETFNDKKPLNPMINAGAITVTSLVRGKTMDEKFQRILSFIQTLANNDSIDMNENVYLSEKATGDRNRSMAYFLKDIGNIFGDVESILDLYFKQCSINVTARDIARIGAVLANDGVDIETGVEHFPRRYAKIAKAYMATCGMYNGSGQFAINVGIPAKSGVGGGVMCAVNGKMGIGVYGPSLDDKGNSVAGMRLLSDLSKEYKLSIY